MWGGAWGLGELISKGSEKVISWKRWRVRAVGWGPLGGASSTRLETQELTILQSRRRVLSRGLESPRSFPGRQGAWFRLGPTGLPSQGLLQAGPVLGLLFLPMRLRGAAQCPGLTHPLPLGDAPPLSPQLRNGTIRLPAPALPAPGRH